MEDYWQQQLTAGLDWDLQQLSNFQTFAAANGVMSGLSRRRGSRVSKPTSAGNSPHSLARRKSMMGHGPTQYRVVPFEAQHYPVDAGLLAASVQRKSRPMSWHPSSRQAGYSQHMATQHSTWADHDACKLSQHRQSSEAFSTASIYGLVTPVSYPTTGESLANEYFSQLDGGYGFSTVSQAFTPSEPTNLMQMDSMAWPSTMYNNPCLPSHLPQDWVQDPLPNGCQLPTSQMVDMSQESLPSSDEFTAPPTPNVFPDTDLQQDLPTKSIAQGDELVGMGLYDEPETFSLENSLVRGVNTNQGFCGKGLKLEETFSPAPEKEDDDEEDDEGDAHEPEEE